MDDPILRLQALSDAVETVHLALRGWQAAAREGLEISAMELAVLAGMCGAADPQTVAALGRSLGHPRQVIQRAADALVAGGLAAQERNPAHRRAFLLVPTASGRALHQVARMRGRRVMGRIGETLDARQVDRTIADLGDIARALAAAGPAGPARPGI